MNRILLLAVALVAMAGAAQAQPKQVVANCGSGVTLSPGDGSAGTVDTTGRSCDSTSASYTTPVAGAQYGVAVSSSTALTVPATATAAVVTIEGNSVRYTDDGTTPTATVGQGPFAPGYVITLYGTELNAARFIQTASAATINVSYYK